MRVLFVALLVLPAVVPVASALGNCVTAPRDLVGACVNTGAGRCVLTEERCVVWCVTHLLGTRIYDACMTVKGGYGAVLP